MQKFNLTNKTALITGASGLLGFEHGKALLEIGANVIITDVNSSALQKTYSDLRNIYPGSKILALFMDVSNIESIKNAKEEIYKNFQSVDVLVNNAAIDPKVKNNNDITELSRLENFSLEQWNLELSVGLTGAMLCSKEFGADMARRNNGVILNIASDLSIIGPDQRLYRKDNISNENQPVKPITYSVIKSGLIGLTRYLATYWNDSGVRCNALSPGGVLNNQDPEFVNRVSKLIPLGRMAEKDEYHSAIQFLCSDASSYMNGQNIIMDGGRSIW